MVYNMSLSILIQPISPYNLGNHPALGHSKVESYGLDLASVISCVPTSLTAVESIREEKSSKLGKRFFDRG